ncbi:DUF58 domain-containing protein [Neptunomonas japonica]|uniref:DUF58 domain-containing protein n=1 Tax=Neptunomonas japonica TaxID=417574 RepID=UPI00040A3250|nr:DUF58 domain-containing protein [Neptunomonas japonica]
MNKRLSIRLTLSGVVLVIVLFLIQLLAINYSNNLLFTFGFMLVSIFLISFWLGLRNMKAIQASCQHVEPVHAGQLLKFHLILSEDKGLGRYQLQVLDDTGQSDLVAHSQQSIELPQLTQVRGSIEQRDATVRSDWPLGFFMFKRSLCTLPEVLVYPATGGRLPLITMLSDAQAQHQEAVDSLAGLRAYQPGDNMRRIHWRALARNEQLQVRQFEGEQGDPSGWLSWDDTSELPYEARISCLTDWVLECDRQGRIFGLRIPGNEIAPESGVKQRHRCLSALANMPELVV